MPQKSTTFSVRVSQQKLSLWKERAGNFNAWVVAALDAQFDLDQAELRDRESGKQERLSELQTAFPQQFAGKKSYKADPR